MPTVRPGQAGGRRDANRRERTAALAGAALDLFLVEGIPAVSIDQIVARAGVAKGSFYRYFEDKEELVGALLRPLADGVEEAFERCRAALAAARAPDQVQAAYLTLAAGVAALLRDHPRAALLYLQESRAPAVGTRAPVRRLADRIAELAVSLSAHARDHGLLRDLDPRVQGLVVLGAVERLLFDALSGHPMPRPAEAVSALVVTIILDGVRRR